MWAHKLTVEEQLYNGLVRYHAKTNGNPVIAYCGDLYLRGWYNNLTPVEQDLAIKFLEGDNSAIEVGKSPEVPAFKAISLTSDYTPGKNMYVKILVILDEKVSDLATTLDVTEALLFKTFEEAEKYGRLLEGYKRYSGWDIVTVLIPEGELK